LVLRNSKLKSTGENRDRLQSENGLQRLFVEIIG